jgi:nicotinamidase-related amidase
MNFQIPVFKTRRALLVIDLQNEFVSETGQCRVIQPNFVDNVINLITEFRKEGGEVIWTRTEYKAHRNLRDVQLVLAEPDSLYTTRDTIEADAHAKLPTAPATTKEEEEKKDDKEQDGKANVSKGRGRSNSDGSQESMKLEADDTPTSVPSDAFLSISNTVVCEKDSPASAFIPALTPEVKRKSDRVITKTWYSAFTDTNLLMMLQGRLVTEVYICGAMTNTSVYATALDAVKFGLKVYIPNDCCGYRHIAAHQDAMAEMTGKLGVESMLSRILVTTWENQRNSGNESSTTVRTVDTSQLQTVVENAIRAGEGGVVLPDPDSDLGAESEWDGQKKKMKGMYVSLSNPESISVGLSDCDDSVCTRP